MGFNVPIDRLWKDASIPVITVVWLWFIGSIVSNAHLSKYGAFSWDLLDLDNLLAGLLLATLVLAPVGIWIPLKAFCQIMWSREASSESKRHALAGLTLLSIVVITLLVTTSHWSSSEPHECEQLAFWCITLLFISSLVMVLLHLSGLTWSKLNVIAGGHCAPQVWYIRYEFWPLLLVLAVSILLAVIFGQNIYGHIPRWLGGGQPVAVRISTHQGDSTLPQPGCYLFLDETSDTFILFDSAEQRALEVKKDQVLEENGGLHFERESSCEERVFLFASDLHVTTDSAARPKYAESLNRLRHLVDSLKNREANRVFVLGDVLELDGLSNIDTLSKRAALAISILMDLPQPTRVIAGNNDSHSRHQLDSFMTIFSAFGFDLPDRDSTLPNWVDVLSQEVAVIGVYLPDITPVISDDPRRAISDQASWLQHTESWLVGKVETLLAQNRGLRLLLILTHRPLIEDDVWSVQYHMYHHHDSATVDRWGKFVKELRERLRNYDNEFKDSVSGTSARRTDIVIVSGHTHAGVMTRGLDGIDHIVCPSAAEESRGAKRFPGPDFLEVRYRLADNSLRVAFHDLETGDSSITILKLD